MMKEGKRERHAGKKAIILWDEAEPASVSPIGAGEDRLANVAQTGPIKPGKRVKEL